VGLVEGEVPAAFAAHAQPGFQDQRLKPLPRLVGELGGDQSDGGGQVRPVLSHVGGLSGDGAHAVAYGGAFGDFDQSAGSRDRQLVEPFVLVVVGPARALALSCRDQVTGDVGGQFERAREAVDDVLAHFQVEQDAHLKRREVGEHQRGSGLRSGGIGEGHGEASEVRGGESKAPARRGRAGAGWNRGQNGIGPVAPSRGVYCSNARARSASSAVSRGLSGSTSSWNSTKLTPRTLPTARIRPG
jgi:hypothetical protein